MNDEPIDAEVVEEPHRALATIPQPPTLAVTPQVQAGELVARLDVIREAMQTAMQENVDYGVIPGTGSKPTLLKPGAEKLGVLFQLDVQLSNQKTWDGDHLTVEACATVFHAPTGVRLGYGEGMCTTREKKYGKRKQERTCPTCGVAAIIKGRQEYGGGWVCFKKKNGCGAKYQDGDPAIESQVVGDIENPDLPDTWNTVVKMAEKRARVDAVLAVTGASALFTQDAEDLPDTGAGAPPAEPPISVASPAQKKKLRAEITRNRVDAALMDQLFGQIGFKRGEGEKVNDAINRLSPSHASQLIDTLVKGAIRTGESDVPAPADDEFRHPAEPGGQFDLADARVDAGHATLGPD